jgi:biopolymer transport protein ExbB
MNDSLTTQAELGQGFAHFLSQTDATGTCVLVLLLLMSLACWSVIILKAWQQWQCRRPEQRFLARHSAIASLPALERLCLKEEDDSAYRRITVACLAACRQWRQRNKDNGFDMSGPEELVARALRQALDQEAAHQETGLTLLATIGSAAPFVGLFGTVWGIYHALIAIGLSGQGSLDKVAGPVGEALIMTACGLAVAIPAVLAYNAFVRFQRRHQDRLEHYAHHLYGFLATGIAPGLSSEENHGVETHHFAAAGRNA